MRSYAQFFINHNNKTQRLLGSDGILPLDSYTTRYNNILLIREHINKLNTNLNQNICKFEIRNCSETFPFDNYVVSYSEDIELEN